MRLLKTFRDDRVGTGRSSRPEIAAGARSPGRRRSEFVSSPRAADLQARINSPSRFSRRSSWSREVRRCGVQRAFMELTPPSLAGTGGDRPPLTIGAGEFHAIVDRTAKRLFRLAARMC